MSDKIFVDTNILIYAYDKEAGDKHKVAVDHISRLWNTKQGVISTQVMQEFYVNVTRKIPVPILPIDARALLSTYLVWQIEVNDPATILFATELQERYMLSFWDALIVASTYHSGVSTILSEDLNAGQFIEGIIIKNPFV
jgi:predicted nucleic acid-binding protein